MDINAQRKKNIIFSLFVFLIFIAGYYYAETHNKKRNIHIEGKTFGVVPYSIKYVDPTSRIFKRGIDSILNKVNDTLSTYVPTSQISEFNKSNTGVPAENGMFRLMVEESKKWSSITEGKFNPSVKPLINLWGFGPERQPVADTNKIDSLLEIVDLDLIRISSDSIIKKKPAISLDFGAIAKGYSVDLVAKFLQSKGIQDYMIEIGGEVACKGVTPSGELWRIGIDNPLQELDQKRLAASIRLDDKSIASSGNYRNYYVKDGKKYAHIIDPKDGYPVDHNLLSVSVIAENCMTADALATGLMVMGVNEARKLQAMRNDFEIILVYDDNGITKSYFSPGLKDMIIYDKYSQD
jgi:thiamine biosynthesis lipoprotein